jgi:hypothetical protein
MNHKLTLHPISHGLEHKPSNTVDLKVLSALFFLRHMKENRKHLQHPQNILFVKLCQFYLHCVALHPALHFIGGKIGENYRVLNEY